MIKREQKVINLKLGGALTDELDHLKKNGPKMEADIYALEKWTYE